MAFTTASRVASINISLNMDTLNDAYPFISGIELVTEESGDDQFFGASDFVRAMTSTTLADTDAYKIAMDIYASANGFRTMDGSPTPVNITRTMFQLMPSDITVEQFEDYGMFNPFVHASLRRWAAHRLQRGDTQRLVTRTETADGQVTHVEQLGRVPGLSSPDGTTQTYHAARWVSRLGPTNQNRFRIGFTDDDGVTDANVTSNIHWKGLWAVLQSIKVAGADVPAAGPAYTADDYDATDPLPGRQFRFALDGNNQTFKLNDLGLAHHGEDNNIDEFWVGMNIIQGTYDAAAYTAWIQSQVVTVGATPNSIVPKQGNVHVPMDAQELVLPDGTIVKTVNGVVHVERPDGTEQPMVEGRNWYLNALPAREGGGRVIQPDRDVDVITVTGTVTESLYWPAPAMLLGPGQRRTIIVINDGSAVANVYNAAGSIRLAVPPGQWTEWLITRDINGTARIRLKATSHKRLHLSAAGSLGVLSDGRFLSYDATNWLRPINAPLAPVYNDADAFTIGPNSWSYTAGVTWTTVTDWFNRGALRIELAGETTFYQACEVKVNTGVVGAIPAGSETVLLRKRAVPVTPVPVATPNSYAELSGSRDTLTLSWLGLLPSQAQDIVIPSWKNAKASGINPGDVNITNFTRAALHTPQILIT